MRLRENGISLQGTLQNEWSNSNFGIEMHVSVLLAENPFKSDKIWNFL